MLQEVSDPVLGRPPLATQLGFLLDQPRDGAEEHTRYEPRRGVEEQVAV